MNLNDLRKNLFYGLGILLTGMLLTILLVFSTTANAATVSLDSDSALNLESPYNPSFYQFSIDREYIPFEQAPLIDNLLRTQEDCPKYMSLIEQFISCSPSHMDSEFVTESYDQDQHLPDDVEQSS